MGRLFVFPTVAWQRTKEEGLVQKGSMDGAEGVSSDRRRRCDATAPPGLEPSSPPSSCFGMVSTLAVHPRTVPSELVATRRSEEAAATAAAADDDDDDEVDGSGAAAERRIEMDVTAPPQSAPVTRDDESL